MVLEKHLRVSHERLSFRQQLPFRGFGFADFCTTSKFAVDRTEKWVGSKKLWCKRTGIRTGWRFGYFFYDKDLVFLIVWKEWSVLFHKGNLRPVFKNCLATIYKKYLQVGKVWKIMMKKDKNDFDVTFPHKIPTHTYYIYNIYIYI